MRPRYSKAGFSLIEVLIAVLILGVGLVGITQGIAVALASSKDAEFQSAAALFAAGQLEILRADGYVIEGESEGACDGMLANYSWLQNVVETQPDGLFEVTLTIQHTESGEELFELKTLLFDAPIIREDEEEVERRNERRSEERRVGKECRSRW